MESEGKWYVSDGKKRVAKSNIILFPACDQRGIIIQILRDRCTDPAYLEQRPENLFFSWLLELPENIDPAAAAESVLIVSGLITHPPAPSQTFRLRLYRMFRDTIDSSKLKRSRRSNTLRQRLRQPALSKHPGSSSHKKTR